MRILNISSLYPPHSIGGAEQGLRIMSEEMVRQGHELHVVTLAPPAWARVSNDHSISKVQVHEVPVANTYWPFSSSSPTRSKVAKIIWHTIDTENVIMARRVSKIVKEVQPDVVLTRNLQGFSTAVIPAVKRLGYPVIHVLHDVSLLCPKTTMFKNSQRCGTKNARCRSCRVFTSRRWHHLDNLDGVIGVSNAVLNSHREHGLFKNIPQTTIYNALKPELEVLSSPPARSDKKTFTFGYLGRIEETKGIETLLEAATKLSIGDIPFKLLVGGRGDAAYVEYLKNRWPGLDVEFAGYVKPVEFFAKIDTLVFPSIAPEALGNGVFEAFSQGVPVIGSNSGGIGESIEVGRQGLIFEAANSGDLWQKMNEILWSAETLNAMSSAALVKAKQYRASNRAKEYLAFIQQVINRSSEPVTA